MPRTATAGKRIRLAAAFLSAFAASGCGTVQEEAIAVDHRMGFLPDSLRRAAEVSPAGFIIHPPAWARIHRDSLCLAVENPDSVAKLLILDVLLRNPRTGDSLGFGQTALSTFLRNRDVACQPLRFLGGREAWQAPVEVELILREYPGSARLASRKLVVDPDFGQLDLKPFPVRFFPDRPGMEWLLEGTSEPGDSFRVIRRLESWTVLPEDPDGICLQDSVVRLRYYSRDCAPGDPPSPEADLLRCSAALDSALAVAQLGLQEGVACASVNLVQLDSAILSNQESGYDIGLLFGDFRATHRSLSVFGGQAWDILKAEGVGAYNSIIVDSAAGFRSTSRILAVK